MLSLWALSWWFLTIDSHQNKTVFITNTALVFLKIFLLSPQLSVLLIYFFSVASPCPIERTGVNRPVGVSYQLKSSLTADFSYWVVIIFVASFHSASANISTT